MQYECTTESSTTTCIYDASTSPAFYNGFSYDGIFVNFLLLLIFLVLFFKLFYDLFIGVKYKKNYD